MPRVPRYFTTMLPAAAWLTAEVDGRIFHYYDGPAFPFTYAFSINVDFGAQFRQYLHSTNNRCCIAYICGKMLARADIFDIAARGDKNAAFGFSLLMLIITTITRRIASALLQRKRAGFSRHFRHSPRGRQAANATCMPPPTYADTGTLATPPTLLYISPFDRFSFQLLFFRLATQSICPSSR